MNEYFYIYISAQKFSVVRTKKREDCLLYKKNDGFQECEASLKHKTELITKLEAKAQSMSDTIETLENK